MSILRVVIFIFIFIVPLGETEMSERTVWIQALAVSQAVSAENWVVILAFRSIVATMDSMISCFNPPEAFFRVEVSTLLSINFV